LNEGLGSTWRMPPLDNVAVSTSHHHLVAVWVAQPELAVVGQGVDIEWFQDFGASSDSPSEGSSHVLVVEPKHDSVAIRPLFGIAQVRMFVSVPLMHLKYQLVAGEQLLVLGAAMPALQAEHVLIPSACGLDVPNGDQWLRFHSVGVVRMLLVLPNVRANRETTAGRQARAGENVPRTTGPGLVACRWLSG
jgi:hypothetical protein